MSKDTDKVKNEYLNEKLVLDILSKYDFKIDSKYNDFGFIDKSFEVNDIRWILLIKEGYVLKINTSSSINEKFLSQMNDVIDKYIQVGIKAPYVIRNKENKFLTSIRFSGITFNCYIEEYIQYKSLSYYEEMYDNKGIIDDFKKKSLEIETFLLSSMGKLANLFKNKDLVDHYSIFSIIDVPSVYNDIGIDEKQDNCNLLVKVLNENGYTKLANKVEETNKEIRNRLNEVYPNLPRCVFQADINNSNILVDDNLNFKALVDFNLYGTDVNINYLINECRYCIDEDLFKKDNKDILDLIIFKENELLDLVLNEYKLNEDEKSVFDDLRKLINLFLYPNVCALKYFIEKNINREKVIELINLMCD